ncbi:MAG: signal peptidase I [Rhabdochlamydiaceae bacterium]
MSDQSSLFSIRKSRRILFQILERYKKIKHKLTDIQKLEIEKHLFALQKTILNKDKKGASIEAQSLLDFSLKNLKKSFWQKLLDGSFSLILALLVALVIRSVCFEFYEIPTGSMRPTFKEKDRVCVSKSRFSINIPFMNGHFLFNPDLLERNQTIVFNGKNMNIPYSETVYFHLFKGQKQYVKRLIGKPGDILYFYGGRIYGIDANDRDISQELNKPVLEKIGHIPFIQFEQKIEALPSSFNGVYSPIHLYQSGLKIAEIKLNDSFHVSGQVLQENVNDYFDLWGFKNFAMSSLLSKEDCIKLGYKVPDEPNSTSFYLRLLHHPSVINAKIGSDYFGRLRPSVHVDESLIPLSLFHINKIFQNMYTCRFIVKDEIAFPYHVEKSSLPLSLCPHLPGVPNGCYEFYYGKCYEVLWGGYTRELKADHPLCQFEPKKVQTLYNLGMHFNRRYDPSLSDNKLMPHRYSYFREGSLYLMDSLIIDKEDPTLQAFQAEEISKEKSIPFYNAFKDTGVPYDEQGAIKISFIKQHGLKVPKDMYFALGDNHAMSSDSRDFGFIPQENLKGSPNLIFWPLGDRTGAPLQPDNVASSPYQIMILITLFTICLFYIIYTKKKQSLPINLE